jgi:hypothetical protein
MPLTKEMYTEAIYKCEALWYQMVYRLVMERHTLRCSLTNSEQLASLFPTSYKVPRPLHGYTMVRTVDGNVIATLFSCHRGLADLIPGILVSVKSWSKYSICFKLHLAT